MKNIILPIGNDSFRKVREDNGYYADKTGIIEELTGKKTEVHLFTRPRRFRKTLMMSMLANFFDISKRSKDIFEGTKIAENKTLCEIWMNQYPIIFLTLKHAGGLHFQSAFERLEILISEWCDKHCYLMDSEYFGFTEQEVLNLLKVTGLSEHAEKIKKWYNGYCFG